MLEALEELEESDEQVVSDSSFDSSSVEAVQSSSCSTCSRCEGIPNTETKNEAKTVKVISKDVPSSENERESEVEQPIQIRRKRYTLETKLQAIELFESGLRKTEVAQRMGASSSLVGYWVDQAPKIRKALAAEENNRSKDMNRTRDNKKEIKKVNNLENKKDKKDKKEDMEERVIREEIDMNKERDIKSKEVIDMQSKDVRDIKSKEEKSLKSERDMKSERDLKSERDMKSERDLILENKRKSISESREDIILEGTRTPMRRSVRNKPPQTEDNRPLYIKKGKRIKKLEEELKCKNHSKICLRPSRKRNSESPCNKEIAPPPITLPHKRRDLENGKQIEELEGSGPPLESLPYSPHKGHASPISVTDSRDDENTEPNKLLDILVLPSNIPSNNISSNMNISTTHTKRHKLHTHSSRIKDQLIKKKKVVQCMEDFHSFMNRAKKFDLLPKRSAAKMQEIFYSDFNNMFQIT